MDFRCVTQVAKQYFVNYCKVSLRLRQSPKKIIIEKSMYVVKIEKTTTLNLQDCSLEQISQFKRPTEIKSIAQIMIFGRISHQFGIISESEEVLSVNLRIIKTSSIAKSEHGTEMQTFGVFIVKWKPVLVLYIKYKLKM
ncbi:Hypothetical_protein [Hexamita inflata]|uniref:Hypothetical_protein n=1 Tax=Hexamita inflata TaxID=28002 RepID=A0AA86PB82_9EUKA|nr:Hypothetical protein HINF_LOCUS22181 [Hexamita inflata]